MNIKKLILIIISVISSFYILLFLNINKYKSDINDYLSKNEIKNKNNIEINIFPFPKIKLNNLNYDHANKYISAINIDEAIIKPSIIGLLSRNLKFTDILFYKVIISSEYKFDMKDLIDQYQSIIIDGNYDIFNNININDLKIINSDLDKSIDIEKLNLSKNNKNIDLYLNQNLINDSKKFHLKIKDKSITASIDSTNNKTILKGLLEQNNIKANISSNIKYNQNLLSRYDILSNASSMIKFNDDAKIDFDINISPDQTIINNLSINSKYIDLAGEININNNETTEILFNIDSLKINNISQADDIVYDNESKHNLFFEDNFKIVIHIKDCAIFDHKIANSDINLNIFDNNIKIYSEDINFDENNHIEFDTIVEDNKFRKALVGKVKLTGKNIYPKNILKNDLDSIGIFTSDIFITQKETRLSNINHNYGKTKINGDAIIKYEDSIPSYDINLNINDLYLDEKYKDNFIIDNKSSSKSDDLDKISKFQSLRMTNSKINLNLNIDDLYIADSKYEFIKSEINLEKGLFAIDNFKIKSDIADFSLKANVNSKLIDPVIYINLYGKKIDFDKIISSIQNNTDMNIESILSSNNISNVKCSFELNLNDVIYDQNNYSDLMISSVLDKNNISISKFNVKSVDSNLISKGNISLNPPTIGMSFAFNNFSSDILSYFGVDYYNGHFSANGSFASSLKDKTDFIKNLQSNIQVVSRDLTIKNFNIDRIIDSTSSDKIYNKSEISELMNNYRDGNTKINEFNAKFMIKNGIVQSNTVSLLNDRFSSAFGGNIDLNNNTTNSVFKVGFIPKPKAKQLDITININGPLNDIIQKPDFSQIEQYLKQQK